MVTSSWCKSDIISDILSKNLTACSGLHFC